MAHTALTESTVVSLDQERINVLESICTVCVLIFGIVSFLSVDDVCVVHDNSFSFAV